MTSIKNTIERLPLYHVIQGPTQEIPFETSSEKLKENLCLAKEMLKTCEGFTSANFLSRSHPIEHMSDLDYFSLAQKTTSLTIFLQSQPSPPLDLISQKKTGNCRQLSLLCIFTTETNKTLCTADWQAGDHFFIIIKDSDENWADAAVCDPWAGTYYPFSQISKYLVGSRGDLSIHGRLYPCIDPELLSREPKLYVSKRVKS